MIGELREQFSQKDLLNTLDVKRSSYVYYEQHGSKPGIERERLKARVVAIHKISRAAPESRTISAKLKEEGEAVGRYKAARLLEGRSRLGKPAT